MKNWLIAVSVVAPLVTASVSTPVPWRRVLQFVFLLTVPWLI